MAQALHVCPGLGLQVQFRCTALARHAHSSESIPPNHKQNSSNHYNITKLRWRSGCVWDGCETGMNLCLHLDLSLWYLMDIGISTDLQAQNWIVSELTANHFRWRAFSLHSCCWASFGVSSICFSSLWLSLAQGGLQCGSRYRKKSDITHWFIFCYCDKTRCPVTLWGGKKWFQFTLPGHGSSQREVRRGLNQKQKHKPWRSAAYWLSLYLVSCFLLS